MLSMSVILPMATVVGRLYRITEEGIEYATLIEMRASETIDKMVYDIEDDHVFKETCRAAYREVMGATLAVPLNFVLILLKNYGLGWPLPEKVVNNDMAKHGLWWEQMGMPFDATLLTGTNPLCPALAEEAVAKGWLERMM